jgi:hypothetical protein
VAEAGVPFKKIAEVIGRRLNIPLASTSPERSAGHFGWLAMLAGFDVPASKRMNRARLGWEPTQPGLISANASFRRVLGIEWPPRGREGRRP